jgi:hypothetical protein
VLGQLFFEPCFRIGHDSSAGCRPGSARVSLWHRTHLVGKYCQPSTLSPPVRLDVAVIRSSWSEFSRSAPCRASRAKSLWAKAEKTGVRSWGALPASSRLRQRSELGSCCSNSAVPPVIFCSFLFFCANSSAPRDESRSSKDKGQTATDNYPFPCVVPLY